MIKHTKPFLGIDYDLLAITSLVINGKTKEVKLHHKIIYSYLLSLSGTYQKVTPSLKGIGERLGVGTDQTVRRHIKDLVSFGWLKIEERAGSTNAYIVLPYEQEAKTQQEATVKAVPEQLPPTEDNKESSFDVLDDWDAPLPWETEETPVSPIFDEKVTNDREDVLENFASLICQEKNTRTGGASFIEFANSLAYRYGLKLPNGIEAYFAKKHPKVYEDFDLPF
ncbi:MULTISPECIES: helix-turn-helix domain-containing protein [Enterobacteriaceae]|uniref:helix-turn-helix domain-containing protein n=1 Tax=Enterobacteriaceae TaxID=543 RepID=UPI000B22BBB3|nr:MULTISPECIES: helix-turn-helix domain-containing protein [Enterobacteriaceae]EEV0715003.1 helix-turn-helix domain-containing protein [Escherichia coli]EEZ2041974.1 helix-turn-helix domain-containing protein [Escherichia coli]EFA6946034.1 helix-turn-helix domain-containing protein [Escherichia coli]EFA7632368.1 helix-turn-helix domain-containing protein [Escherichia coli]EFB4052183.1 helix-turn-helix domain-containing protein [Escherichia coli]